MKQKSKPQMAKLRREYSGRPLTEGTIEADPFAQFAKWFEEAVTAKLHEPNAMALATVGVNGQPAARMVLLKGFDATGFRFYTNYESRKGIELATQPRASLLFYWGELERQVRIEGIVRKISAKESAEYFATRPRGAQLGAAASQQSRPVASRQVLESRVSELSALHGKKPVPCPAEWGGYILKAAAFEFWQGRKDRLHDRIAYALRAGSWRIARLAP